MVSGLRLFSTSALLCVHKALKLMHFFPDPTMVDPLCSDPMDEIFSLLLCYTFSLGTDPTDQDSP
jgi:hypothetical protein